MGERGELARTPCPHRRSPGRPSRVAGHHQDDPERGAVQVLSVAFGLCRGPQRRWVTDDDELPRLEIPGAAGPAGDLEQVVDDLPRERVRDGNRAPCNPRRKAIRSPAQGSAMAACSARQGAARSRPFHTLVAPRYQGTHRVIDMRRSPPRGGISGRDHRVWPRLGAEPLVAAQARAGCPTAIPTDGRMRSARKSGRGCETTSRLSARVDVLGQGFHDGRGGRCNQVRLRIGAGPRQGNREASPRMTDNAGVEASPMDLRTLQRPLKERYRSDPSSSRITLSARAARTDSPLARSTSAALFTRQKRTAASAARARRPVPGTCCWGSGRLRADHLPDGRDGDGHPDPRDRRGGRRRPGPAALLGSPRTRPLASSRSASASTSMRRTRRRATARLAGKGRTILCGHADVDPAAQRADGVVRGTVREISVTAASSGRSSRPPHSATNERTAHPPPAFGTEHTRGVARGPRTSSS